MKIALEGAMSTGKTTTGLELAKRIGCKFIPEAAREALSAGFKLDKTANIESQLWILSRQFETEMRSNNNKWDFIADRGLLSVAAYTYLNKNIKVSEKMFLYRFIRGQLINLQRYDKIIYFPPAISLKDDGVRETDASFQRRLHMAYLSIIKNWNLNIHVVQSLTIEDRTEELYKLITTPDEV